MNRISPPARPGMSISVCFHPGHTSPLCSSTPSLPADPPALAGTPWHARRQGPRLLQPTQPATVAALTPCLCAAPADQRVDRPVVAMDGLLPGVQQRHKLPHLGKRLPQGGWRVGETMLGAVASCERTPWECCACAAPAAPEYPAFCCRAWRHRPRLPPPSRLGSKRPLIKQTQG